ncbi:site-specific DNA-methyltransferase [Ruminococcus flavefaciens]|uniref:site-specific DNA-methyltransferase n=1 Tax=Ruminococcus flavefaciens TaxID=1265 RepID=UPI0026EE0A01|nr:site-specific DNA-methyltransferase [Ruminococcus flavefaciens]
MKNLIIDYVPIEELKPYEGNAKLHPKEQIEQIKKSIKEFGFNDPVAVWKDSEIIEGHGRLIAAKELGLTEIPIIRLDDLTDQQRKAYMLAHNKLTMNSDFDLELLTKEIESIIDFDMTDFGFDSLFDDETVVEDEYNAPLPEEPKAKPGDIYQLGRHRLMCGDSTSQEDVQKLLAGQQVDMVLTDPPYNVNYKGTAGRIMNDNMESSEFRQFLKKAFLNIRLALKNGCTFHIWYADSEGYNFRGACAEAGLIVRQQLIWVKNSATIGRQDFQHQYESVLSGLTFDESAQELQEGFSPCLYGWKDGAAHRWYKKRKERDVMFFDKPKASKEHPTMKPVLLFDYEMQCNTKPGDSVLDLFGGSGTLIIAAQQNKRTAYVMEYDPKYVDVIIDRWEKFTGEKAVKLN